MCGIAGIVLSPSVSDPRWLAEIDRMTASLRHRGPDGDGFWIDRHAGVALGHRRLAIIDLSEAGRQPMISHSGRLVVTYNGEIYNFADIRSELAGAGIHFRSHSDTEVMLAAFEHFGLDAALQRFAGMFAIGLWDYRTRALHLIRDRLGKKPLYVALADGVLLFGSELKAICAFRGFQPRLDPGALDLMLRYGWVPEQHCIWEGVVKLPPGGMLSVGPDELAMSDADCLRRRVRNWWSLATVAQSGQRHPTDLSPAFLEGELDRLLRIAVRERMVADVPLGALLSGGIDSSTVVALMQAQSLQSVRTFTIGYSDARYDEADDAACIARHLGTDHTELRLTPEEALAVIPDLPQIWDEPFADESQIPTFLVSRLARQHVTVALSGDGGDEAFGGYTRHILSARLGRVLDLPFGLCNAGAFALRAFSADFWLHALPYMPFLPKERRKISREHLQKLIIALGATDEQDLYFRLVSINQTAPIRKRPMTDADALDLGVVLPLKDRVSRQMYRDTIAYLPADILVKLDRASMAVGLEGRCPLLDHRIIEFAWGLPASVKVRGGQGKWILRRVLRRYVPDSLFERPKHGFDVPIGEWLKGPLHDWAGDLLATSRISREGLLDPARVQTLWAEHQSGRHDRACALWAILMFQTWSDAQRQPIRSEAGTEQRPNGHHGFFGISAMTQQSPWTGYANRLTPGSQSVPGDIEATNGQ